MSEDQVLLLTTTGRRSGLPREIEIWYVSLGRGIYLAAETGEAAQWVRNLRADPRARWRIGDRAWTGRGRVLDEAADAALLRGVRARFLAKYGWNGGLAVELVPEDTPGRR